MQPIIPLWNFLIVNNFSGFATLLAGSIAWFIYNLQKRDKKINAARIILSEIRTAENRIDEISSLLERKVNGFPSILPVNSWKTYSHLFASDFDQDQLEEINNFYSVCEEIEEVAKRDNSYFWLTSEYISQAGQSIAVELIIKSLKDDLSLNESKLAKLKQSVLDNIAKHPFMYAPQRTIDTLNISVNKVQKITTSTTGIKLKQLANLS